MKKWALDTAERAGRTFLQVLIGFMATEGAVVGFEDVHWGRACSVAGVAAVVSVVMSVLAVGRGDPTDASLLK